MSAVLEPPGLYGDQQIAQLRVPPHSIEAESSVLGGLLLGGSPAWDLVGDLLAEADFYRHEHRLIFTAIGRLELAAKPVDVMTVYDQLQLTGEAEKIGGYAYLNSLAQYVPSSSNIRRYAEIVRERAILRKLIVVSDEIATAAFNTCGKPVDRILDEAERKIFAIGQSEAAAADEWQDMEEAMTEFIDRIQRQAEPDAAPDYTPTGWSDLDERLDGGPRAGELVTLAARSGMGKSAGGLTIAVNVSVRTGLPCPYFSMEMPKQQLQNRAVAMQAQIHLSRIKRPERLRDYDWPSITEAVERLRRARLLINDQSRLNINQVRAKARALKRRHGKLGCVVVDHLGLMAPLDPRLLRTYQIAEITQGLKSLAKELGCPIFLLVQVNRVADDRPDPMPTLADLRDSASIEDDSDIVFFIHRPIKLKPDLGDEWRNYAKVFVAKLRDGEPGYLHLWYTGEHTHFQDWPTDVPVPTSLMRAGKSTKVKEL